MDCPADRAAATPCRALRARGPRAGAAFYPKSCILASTAALAGPSQGLVVAEQRGMEVTAVAEPKMAFGAYEPKDRHSRYRSRSFKVMLVAADCLLLGLQPVLVSPGGGGRAAARRRGGRVLAPRLRQGSGQGGRRPRQPPGERSGCLRVEQQQQQRRPGTALALAGTGPGPPAQRPAPCRHAAAATASLLLLLLLQVHLSKNKEGKYNFNPVSVNFLVELTKTVIALIVLLVVVRRAALAWPGLAAAEAAGAALRRCRTHACPSGSSSGGGAQQQHTQPGP
jgi:hypothetical protein